MIYILPIASNAKAVERGTSANLINENPGCTSAPSSSTTDAGMVGGSVGAFMMVAGGARVSVGIAADGLVAVDKGVVFVLVTG